MNDTKSYSRIYHNIDPDSKTNRRLQLLCDSVGNTN